MNNRGLFAFALGHHGGTADCDNSAMRTRFGDLARVTPFCERQLELIVGSLMGDATLLATTAGFCFRVHHGVAQRYLVDWKYEQLRAFVRTPPRISGAGYYFRTVSHPKFKELRAAFYDGQRKSVPLDVLEKYLSPLALAVWIMDDGAADRDQLRINTQSFSVQECTSLVDLLQAKFGLKWSINMDKGKPRLRCASASMPRLTEMLMPHFVPEMRYKLPRREMGERAGTFPRCWSAPD